MDSKDHSPMAAIAETPRADPPRLPIIDLSLFDGGDPWRDHLAAQVDWAASTFGFFYVVGHGIEAQVAEALMESSRRYFVRSEHEARGGQAEVPADGDGGYPDLADVADVVGDYTAALTGLGHKLMATLGRGLALGDSYFVDRYTGEPRVRLRIFNYPPAPVAARRGPDQWGQWGVAPHTDDGFLTIVRQDDVGGLELRHAGAWLQVPYVPDSFVVAIGGQLEQLTNGRYVSALHRVRNNSVRARLSLPFFFDPAFDAVLAPIAEVAVRTARAQPALQRDGVPLRHVSGIHGERVR
jgi:isopenicillin N synthase-like dioxygenase